MAAGDAGMIWPMSTPSKPRVRRAYDEPEPQDGIRVLVDRLWPRGLSKDSARIDEWLKDVAPSTELRRWYGHDDASALPRNIATREAFENAMALDVAMGGSTNTVLHILAAAQEGEVDFDLAAIDAVSKRVPCLAKVSPNSDYHMEDVHRAGGIPAILGELRRGGMLDESVHTVHSPTLAGWLDAWDIRSGKASETAVELFHAAPGGVRTTEAFSTQNRWSSLDTDAEGGCIRDAAHAYTADGGLAVLRGNIAPDGAIIKTAGVPEDLWHFAGPARVVESQEEAVSAVLTKQVRPGDVIVVGDVEGGQPAEVGYEVLCRQHHRRRLTASRAKAVSMIGEPLPFA